MDIHGEINRFITTITQPESSQHITFSRDTNPGTTPFSSFCFNFLPQTDLNTLHLVIFRIRCNFLKNSINFLQFQINNIVHQALSDSHMFLEQLVIKIRVFLERIYHVRIQVNCQQTTWVIRTQRNLSTRIRGNRSVTQIGIAVGHTLPNNRIPEQDSRFGWFPRIINNLIPQFYRANLFHVFRFVRIYRIFLNIITFFDNRIHELIINFHRNISSGYFPLGHFRVNETFRIRVIDRNTQHQGSPTTILRYLPGWVWITLHERNNSSGCQGRILNWRPFRTNMG